MASDPITATNLSNWLPDIWARDVLADVEKKLLVGQFVDRSYEGYVRTGGNRIVVPHLAEISPNVVNTAVDMTLYDAVQNVTNIDIDIKYDIGVSVDDINQVQSNPKYFEKVRDKLAYGLAKQIDSNIAGLFPALDKLVGTVNVAITTDNLIDAYEYLNDNDAPDTDRHWVIDPGTITDLLKTDYFIRMDYVPGSVVSQGFTGRQIFGSPVHWTTNLPAYAGGPHAAAYFHREAIAFVLQLGPRFEVARLPLRHSDAIVGIALFGVKEMRGTFGVCINTRS